MSEKKNLLLIDDDDDELEIFTVALNELNIPYSCTCAKDPVQALRILKGNCFDYIFLDINMPKMNGIQCLAEIQKIKGIPQVPIIMYSTYMDNEVCRKAFALGATACIKKPWEMKSLCDILGKILSGETKMSARYY